MGGVTFASPLSAPMLPKLKPLLWPGRVEGGLPPLAAGCGMGEGEWVGEVTRGSLGALSAGV